jgi:hypothetical protein
MKVPYFLLELGDVTIFQPQNIKPDWRDIYLESTTIVSVRSIGSPAHDSRALFLNGAVKDRSFTMLKLRTTLMKTFETIIDNHNRSLDV